MLIQTILAALGLILSAFFSSSEIAVISAHPLQLQKWVSQKKPFALSALKMYEKRQHYLTLILIGNTVSNVLTTTFATLALTAYGFNWWQVILIIAAVVLVFGEVLPKSLVRIRPSSFLLFSTVIIKVFGIVLHPLARLFERIITRLLKLFKSDAEPLNIMIRREEIEKRISESYDHGIINKEKKKYIDRLFEFSETMAGEIITPRTDIVALDEETSFVKLKKAFIQSGFSKIIIYRDNIDQILGYVSLRDVVKTKQSIKEIIRPIKFYPESKNVIELLQEFQESKTSIAIIVDEFGVSTGLVTMEDIVEEIFGEFDDEFDENIAEVRRYPNGELSMSGRTEIDLLNDEFALNIPEGGYETIAGYILDYFDRFPSNGEVLVINNLEFTILKASPKSVDYIKLRQLVTGK
ncbi:MAG: hemolysin family protein [Candidatus Neomarinimicrobiota bacterium]